MDRRRKTPPICVFLLSSSFSFTPFLILPLFLLLVIAFFTQTSSFFATLCLPGLPFAVSDLPQPQVLLWWWNTQTGLCSLLSDQYITNASCPLPCLLRSVQPIFFLPVLPFLFLGTLFTLKGFQLPYVHASTPVYGPSFLAQVLLLLTRLWWCTGIIGSTSVLFAAAEPKPLLTCLLVGQVYVPFSWSLCFNRCVRCWTRVA